MISKNNVLLFLVFALGSIAIISRGYFSMGTYLSTDSKQYLSVAQNLLEGNGPYLLKDNPGTYFSTWPLGYPLLIAGTSMIFHISVYWGSKILNIIILLLVVSLLKRIYKQHAYNYALLLLWASYLEIFSYTWSESAFILGLIWFSYAMRSYNEKESSLIIIANVLLSSLFLFLIRYIGVFSICFIGIMALHHAITKKYKSSARLMAIFIIQLLIVSVYLYINLQKTGHMTGIGRPGSMEGNLELFYSLVVAMFFELNVFMAQYSTRAKFIACFVIQMIVVYYFLRNRDLSYENKTSKVDSFSMTCLYVGSTYLFCITCLRWMKDFDELGYRFLAPGTLLLYMFLISHLRTKYNEISFNIFSNCLMTLSLFSYFVNVPFELIVKLL